MMTGDVIVDLNANPYILPPTYEVEEHVRSGSINLSSERIGLYLSPHEQWGDDLWEKELRHQPLLNVNVLYMLLMAQHQHFIPEAWKQTVTYFGGTTYSRPVYQTERVRCLLGLAWSEYRGWEKHESWLDRHVWAPGNPFAIRQA